MDLPASPRPIDAHGVVAKPAGLGRPAVPRPAKGGRGQESTAVGETLVIVTLQRFPGTGGSSEVGLVHHHRPL
jgi:hypothetical protein